MSMPITPAYIWMGIALCAGSTYLVRVLPVLLFRKPIQSPYIQSLLYYVPYAVLTAMTIPAVFYAGNDPRTALCGVIAAGVTAYFHGSLLQVACTAAAVVYVMTLVLS